MQIIGVGHITADAVLTMPPPPPVDVIEASKQGSIVVDFWAPWCGPCKELTPTLEKLTQESPDVTLVKINTDENPRVAQAFQIESIPNVKAFRNGELIAEFLGAQPEEAVREFFSQLDPSEADLLANRGDAALAQGQLQQFRFVKRTSSRRGSGA